MPQADSNTGLYCIRGLEGFFAIKDDWNRLLSESPNDTIFLRHEWITSWWMSYGGRSELNVLILKKGERLAGAAPLMTVKDRTRGLPAKKISFIGDPTWTVEDFIIAADAGDALRRFTDYLLGMSWDMADLRNIPSDSGNIGAFKDILKSKRIDYLTVEAASSPYLRIEASWEDFYAKRSTRFKKALRNKLNKINKSGSVTIRKYSSPEEVRRILPVVFEIGLKGWKHTIKNAVSSTPENRSFYTALSEVMSGLGWLDIWLLEFNGAPVAFEYHIRYRDRVHALVADFDENYRHLSPGSVLDFHIMQNMFRNGVGEYDLGCGDSFYKSNWTETARKHIGLNFCKNNFYGKALMFVEKRVVPPLKSFRDRLKKDGDRPAGKAAHRDSFD